ncbi:MAG TPA: tetratricopeptide repeat protein, partial [Polyangiaceae bacterium]|nr:tetratricopeptide repeat protein [Polyangiaceae bacterium]
MSLGRRVAELQDRAPEARLDRDRGRALLLQTPLPAAPAPKAAKKRLVVARALAPLVATVAMAAVFALWLLPREAIHFEVGASGPGALGEWIAAPPSAELPIRFSDGSVLRLARGGRVRVATVSAEGAEIALERGALDLAVVHRDGTRWMVRAGPFRVDVVGTRFDTRWDPIAEELDVALHEGVIIVSGPVVGDLRRVRAGEELHVSIPKGTLEVGVAAPSVKEPSASAPDEADEAPEAVAPAPAPSTQGSPPREISPRSTPAPAPRARASWRNLARDARYKEALAAAEAEGFDALCASASAGDLQALADAARLGGGPARATQALSALRGRFPGSPESASAAFLLGRMAEDRRGDYAGAIAWFQRYLAEAPRGELAEDARGRIVEAADKMGDLAAA